MKTKLIPILYFIFSILIIKILSNEHVMPYLRKIICENNFLNNFFNCSDILVEIRIFACIWFSYLAISFITFLGCISFAKEEAYVVCYIICIIEVVLLAFAIMLF
jgi:hypothetical protein